ncbi:hypothetical protein SSS_01592 [Sarcoptes scabiei]|uniref:Protein kinase domain-containing protein n=1 Tax=Sarcoptes scabiei TaxID=52283 RepID=A0A834R7J8_SARSC|nr:hypothetical protein SSS_01592 [Sarcoptes scabiei]
MNDSNSTIKSIITIKSSKIAKSSLLTNSIRARVEETRDTKSSRNIDANDCSGGETLEEERIEKLKSRQKRLEIESQKLRQFVSNHQKLKNKFRLLSKEKDLERYDFQLKNREEFTSIGHYNTFYSVLHRACSLVRKNKTSNTNNNNRLKYVFRIDSKLFQFFDEFQIKNNLKHIVWNEIFVPKQTLKQWIHCLADTLEWLNVSGVAHRYVRLENLLIANNVKERIILSNFDMACIYCDLPNEPILQQRGLPIDLEASHLDHLPPESALENYDASQTDVWSVGTIICLLLVRSNPFQWNDSMSHIDRWLKSWERMAIDEEFRSLLDDIFQTEQKRMTIFDLTNDQRLLEPSKSDDLLRTKPINRYRRIHLNKSGHVDTKEFGEKEKPDTGDTNDSKQIILSHLEFSDKSKEIFSTKCYDKIADEKSLLKYRKIQIDRNKSFGKELSNFLNESFLRWRKDRTISTERVANNESIESGLAKIFLLPMITTRHRNILLNEGGKILKFLSKNYQSELISKSIHKVFEIFLCEKQLIFLFEPLHDCRTLLDLFRTVSNVDTDHNENDGIGNDLLQAETRPNQNHITLWSIQLIEVLIFLHNNAISHRYIRPEFVYIENYQPNLPRISNDLNDLKDFKQNHLKLGHFDMACFVWNPNERVTTLRHYGLQDELLENWNHLPPECFQEKYDSLLIDVWSFGTLLLYCLWQNNPFLVPHNEEQAKNNWIEYRSKHIQNQSNSKQLLSILDLILSNRSTEFV